MHNHGLYIKDSDFKLTLRLK